MCSWKEPCSSFKFLNSGWGLTDKYSWKENNEYIYISSSLGPNIDLSHIKVNLTKDSIKVDREGSIIPLFEGKTKGKIDVDDSFWTLEEQKGASELQITLKKSEQFQHEWFGVLVDENVQLKDYYGNSDSIQILTLGSTESHGIYCTKYFRNVESKNLGEMFVRWMKREADEMVPFGRPKTEIGFSYLSEASGDKLIFLGLEYDEYMRVVIKPNENDPNSSELLLINGPKTNILKGSYGTELKDRLVKSINVLINCFETDVNKLLTLMSTSKVKSTYDYSGSNAILNVNNLEDYVNYHKKLDEIMKGKRSDLIQSEEVKNELSKAKADEKTSSDISIAKLAEAISITERKKPKEQIKTIISNLKKNLSLDSMQMGSLFKNAVERLSRQVEENKKREEEISKVKSTDSWFESQMEPKTIIDKTEDPFYAIMNNPANMETSLLVRKYHSISKTQQEKLRERWNNNAKRLNLLVNELFEATPDVLSTICNNYRDLLISEDYPTIMRSYIVNKGIKSEREKERLRYLNEFVLSIYKDAEIYTLKDEQYQLSKIKQICDWAINDFENINDLVEANKNQYDVHFMSYIKLLIQKESEIFEKSGVSMRPENNPWLSILTIIQIAIRSMMEADIAEDLYLITNIVHMKIPKVRTHMTEFILATMPRSDWKSFKKLVFTLTDALINKGKEEGNMENVPEYVPEACHQLRREVESMIPDWIIEELLSENDKKLMMENNKRKSPLFQIDFSEKSKRVGRREEPSSTQKIRTH
ncbi:hypothetical protein MACK_002150 [Theileria orientalis]|uniref:NudC domain-containing protein 1 n=1 Tax=Theileria orientalis TaxID=68886 RepID=A0A976QU27_THEOR|nr:hypothetical protein MACK_002150 [Theileria orientalis]